MKKYLNFFVLTFVCVSTILAQDSNQGTIPNEIVAPKVQGKLNYKLDDYRNYFGAWCGGAGDSLWFARNMGMRHIIYQRGMERHPLAKGMNFYIVNPEYLAYKDIIDLAKKYSDEDIKKWREHCAMKDASLPFPDCMATGWFFKRNHKDPKNKKIGENVVALIANMQSQSVIDKTIDVVMDYAKRIENANPKFKFAGFVWDVPQLEGDFWTPNGRWNKQVGMKHWNVKDTVSVPEGVKLDYPTYCEGRVAFYRQIRSAGQKLNPNVKLIVDPAVIYEHYTKDFQRLGIKPDDPAIADLIQLEDGIDGYLRDKKAWDSGYLKTENLANAVDHYCYDFNNELKAVGSIAALGGWSCWFGNPCPAQGSIASVPPRMKLSRSIATWENLNNTPTELRQWNSEKLIYDSPTAHISKNLIWATHPETKKIFFCFLSRKAKLKIPEGMQVVGISPLNAVFAEYNPRQIHAHIKKCFKIENGTISITKEAQYLVGEAFALTLKPAETVE